MLLSGINDDMESGPLATEELASIHSNYSAFRSGRLALLSKDEEPGLLARFVHNQFRALVLDTTFPCVGAKAAFHRDTYRFGMYPEMASPAATAGLCQDLRAFVAEQPSIGSNFATFIASFTGPQPEDWSHFDVRIRRQLQFLRDMDSYEYDRETQADAKSLRASFSFAGRAFFLVEFYAASPHWTRRFAWPTLVFNPRHQFERLREEGKFERFQQVVQARERALQESINRGAPKPTQPTRPQSSGDAALG
jgi:FPC/CPF motif-containing protein YcgG